MNRNYTILLDSINKVKDFANMISRYQCDADLASGRYTVMGIFSLDLQNPLTLTVYEGSDIDDLEKALTPFLSK